jgi:AcrR family transcriptional regulator
MPLEPQTKLRGPRGPYAKSLITRGAILEAALEVFGQLGFRSGSLKNVADRVGISEAGLLHHFRNKTALLQAVLELRDDEARRLYEFPPDDGRGTVRGLLQLAAYNETTPGAMELYCVVSAEATDPSHPAYQFFQNRYEFLRTLIGDALTQIGEKGELRPGIDAASAARGLIALWDGLQVQWLYERGSFSMERALRAYVDAILVAPLDEDDVDPRAVEAQASEPA